MKMPQRALIKRILLAAAKWDPRRVGYYRARFEEETACLQRPTM